jgi:hypothetical protein
MTFSVTTMLVGNVGITPGLYRVTCTIVESDRRVQWTCRLCALDGAFEQLTLESLIRDEWDRRDRWVGGVDDVQVVPL